MGDREDVLTGFHFEVIVDGFLSGYFLELTGVDESSEVIDHKVMAEQAKEDIIFKIPGRTTGGATLTLKQGITSNMQFWTWRQMVVDGDVAGARQNGSINMYNQALEIIGTWEFTEAWPSKIDGPTFTSDATTYGVEELTIVTETFGRVV
ncbi:MAG: phage tail protein [Chloroflexota bacterium]